MLLAKASEQPSRAQKLCTADKRGHEWKVGTLSSLLLLNTFCRMNSWGLWREVSRLIYISLPSGFVASTTTNTGALPERKISQMKKGIWNLHTLLHRYLLLATACRDLAHSVHIIHLQLLLAGANSEYLNVSRELLAADGYHKLRWKARVVCYSTKWIELGHYSRRQLKQKWIQQAYMEK